MKKISFWASKHIIASRLVITLIHVSLFILCDQLAHLFSLQNIMLPSSLLPIAISLLVAIVLVYRSTTRGAAGYYKRKGLEMLTALITCLAIITGLNNNAFLVNQEQSGYAATIETSSAANSATSMAKPSKPESRLSARAQIKELKTQLKTFKRSLRHKSDTSDGNIFLIILMSVGLTFLLALLSCSISCGGAEVLALLVFLVGLGAIIFLCISLINNEKRKKKKKETTPPVTQPPTLST
jgi:hypothetical protein